MNADPRVCCALFALVSCAAVAVTPFETPERWTFRGVQEYVPAPKDVDAFCAHITNSLGKIGVRQLVIRFAYHYEFKSHPECRQKSALTEAQVRRIRAACDAAGIELIPKMNLFGHQHPLFPGAGNGPIDAHPEFLETRGGKESHKDMPCLCAKNEEARKIVADLMLELAGVCGAKRVHIGCDEVMDIGVCGLCKDTPRDRLYADWVNGVARDLKAKGLGVMIWGDRLIHPRDYWKDDWSEETYATGYSGTKDAVKLLDRDIVICDWQYFVKKDYRSIDIFQDNGYKIILSVWNEDGSAAAERFLAQAKAKDRGQIMGFLLTSWHGLDFVSDSFEGRFPAEVNRNERRRTARCDYARVLQFLFPKTAEALHGGWTWWNGGEPPLDPIEGKAFEPRAKVDCFYDRLPVAHSNEIPAEVWRLQMDPAGEILRFKTGSDRLRLRWKSRFDEAGSYCGFTAGTRGVDVYQFENGQWECRRPLTPVGTCDGWDDCTWPIAPNLPTHVYLPLQGGLRGILVGVRAPFDPEPLGPRTSGVTKPVVVYGSSSAQGVGVSRPGLCWTSVAGRTADVPVVNLGFAGQGRMEDVLCTCLIEADASLYVLDTADGMDVKLLGERCEKFLRRLHAAKPKTPIAVVLDVRAADPGRNALLRRLCAKLKAEDARGWENLHLLGDGVTAITPDDLGAQRLGTYLGREIRSILNGDSQRGRGGLARFD